MNIIEKILSHIIGGVILGGFIICFALLCCRFLNTQNLDNYFMNDNYYIINEDEYILKKDINLCGETYHTGFSVDSGFYNECMGK